MQYIIAFLEGIITFISPCLLPMLPIYISYFAGGGERSVRKTLTGSLGFVTGFSIIFVILGALAGTVGSDRCIACLVCHLDRFQCLRYGTDLI